MKQKQKQKTSSRIRSCIFCCCLLTLVYIVSIKLRQVLIKSIIYCKSKLRLLRRLALTFTLSLFLCYFELKEAKSETSSKLLDLCLWLHFCIFVNYFFENYFSSKSSKREFQRQADILYNRLNIAKTI